MNDAGRLRCVLCDDDQLYTSLIERMLGDLGHEVVGVAATAADGTALLETAHPDLVILDLSMDFNSDFDIVASTLAVGATALIFSKGADDASLSRYAIRPTVVYKPDLTELEHAVTRVARDRGREVGDQDRRARPASAASGAEPTSVADAQAFYGSLNDAAAGDALLSIELPETTRQAEEASDVAMRVRVLLRTADRLVASATSVRVLLPNGGEALATILARLGDGGALPGGAIVRAVTIVPDELPNDAFERLKAAEPSAWPPPVESDLGGGEAG